MADKKVKIAFVGVGGMGQCAHLKNYAALPEDCEVVAIAELQEGMATKVAARYGIPRVYKNHSELLANEKVDGIVASQPFTRHGILIPDLLKAGVPVFSEKPIAGSLEQGEKIVAAVKKSGTFHMVGYHKRSDPATVCAKAEIEKLKASNELGKMKYIRITMPPGDWIAGGFSDLIRSTGPKIVLERDPAAPDMSPEIYKKYDAFVNYYIHQVNLMRHLLGEAYQVTHADPCGVVLLGRSDSGVSCVIEMAPYSTTLDWQEVALVCFEKGWVKLELLSPLASNRPGRVEIFKDPGDKKTPETIVPQLPWVHAMRNQALNFIKAIRGDIQAPCLAEEALEDLKLARNYIRLFTGQ